jgi:hypothetical protein
MPSAIQVDPEFARQSAQRGRGARRFFWFVSALTALFGGAIGLFGGLVANGAPQQAAAAAMGCVIVIAPYVFARAVDELSR